MPDATGGIEGKGSKPKLSAEAVEELAILTELPPEEVVSAVEALKHELEQAPRTSRSLQTPYTPEFVIPLESREQKARVVELLEKLGIFPWIENGQIIIDHRRDLRKLEFAGLRTAPTTKAPGVDEMLPDAFAMPFPLPSTETLSERSQRFAQERPREEQEDQEIPDEPLELTDELEALINRFDQGLIDEDDAVFQATAGYFPSLKLFPREYIWKNGEAIERRTGKVLTEEDQQKIVAEAKAGDAKAVTKLVRMHRGLVLKKVLAVRDYIKADSDDLFQEGMLGLIASLKRYTPGVATFGTFAKYAIEQNMRRFAFENRHPITRPSGVSGRISRVMKAKKDAKEAGSIEPEDVVERIGTLPLGVDKDESHAYQLDRIERTYLMNAAFDPVSDELADEAFLDPVSPDDVVDQNQLIEEIRHVLSTLPPKQELILRLRFGLDRKLNPDEHDSASSSWDGLTLEQVGERLGGLSRERVRKIEATALRHLRHPSRSRALRWLIDY